MSSDHVLEADPRGPWEPAALAEVRALFSQVDAPWWVAGGYAIELAVGAPFRAHGDIDVLLLRRDQLAAQQALATWEWWAADPPGALRRWLPGTMLPKEVHDIWCRPTPEAPWRVQIMLDESEGEHWVSRRDARIRRPVAAIGRTAADGMPYLAPEIQLFYKAKNVRAKDEADFVAVLPRLSASQREWLHDAIALVYGGHDWAARLDG
jgi:hypothetical protein